MLCRNKLKIAQNCSVKEGSVIIEGVKYCDYGLTVSKVIDDDVLIIADVDSISTDKSVVLELLSRIECEDVDPITLHDIVEDYLSEIASIAI